MPSTHYRPGDWNTLKVRVAKDRIQCFVNDQLVVESTDTGLTSGAVGLAKFRDTRAEFRSFQMAKQLPPARPAAQETARILKAVEAMPLRGQPSTKLVDALTRDVGVSATVLRERAALLEQQAAQLRDLAQAVHQQRIQTDLAQVLQGKEPAIDLLRAALLVAKLDNEEVDIEVYRQEVERMAREVAGRLANDADAQAKLAALNQYLFQERGFHGSRGDYYHRSNSYLNEVIDDREGLPITLALLYMELAQRIGLKVVGVGLPGHFVVRHTPAEGEAQLIDVYEAGQPLSRADAEQKVKGITGQPLKAEHLAAVSKRAIIVRMIHNLLGNARRDRDLKGMARYLDTILTITPDAAEERWLRAMVRLQLNHRDGARADADWLLEHRPAGIELERVQEFRRFLDRTEP
jgi:regulator of sirC expression with transglutaminase-like and TPR domain